MQRTILQELVWSCPCQIRHYFLFFLVIIIIFFILFSNYSYSLIVIYDLKEDAISFYYLHRPDFFVADATSQSSLVKDSTTASMLSGDHVLPHLQQLIYKQLLQQQHSQQQQQHASHQVDMKHNIWCMFRHPQRVTIPLYYSFEYGFTC